MKNKIRVAVLGSTGYVGMELVKILSNHTYVDINFLGSETIHDTYLNNIDNIVEIGPGTGNLTKNLIIKNPRNLFVIEKDENLCNLLGEKFNNVYPGNTTQAGKPNQSINNILHV